MNRIADVPEYDVTRQPMDGMFDIMGGDLRRIIPIHNHGLVALCDVMPRFVPTGRTADFAVVQAARVSYGEGTKKKSEDRALIRYLLKHRHTTPFEMVELKWHHKMPIFIARQWIRHRTASVNEVSGRYSIVKEEFFKMAPGELRAQSLKNKQGGDEPINDMTAQQFDAYLARAESQYKEYERLVGEGVSRELARIGLPLGLYTEWYWKIDLKNLLHFLGLRMDSHAQKEIQDYAKAMFFLLNQIVPISCEAWVDYFYEAMTLSKQEIEGFQNGNMGPEDSREQIEFLEKRKLLLGSSMILSDKEISAVRDHVNVGPDDSPEQIQFMEKKKALGLP